MTVDVTAATASTPPVDGLDAELAALRDKAGRICDELAALYQRVEELQRRIEDHQRR